MQLRLLLLLITFSGTIQAQQQPTPRPSTATPEQPHICENFLPATLNSRYAKYMNDAASSCLQSFSNLFSFIQTHELDERNYTVPSLLFGKVENWEMLCRHWQSTVTCLQSARPECNTLWAEQELVKRNFITDKTKRFPSPLYAFSQRNCDKNKVKVFVSQLYRHDFYNPTCLKVTEWEYFVGCTSGSKEVMDFVEQAEQSADPRTIKSTLDGIVANSLRCVRNVLTTSKCNIVTNALLFHMAKLQLPAIYEAPDLNLIQNALMVLNTENKCTVGVISMSVTFIIMCKVPAANVKCSAPGHVIYLSNDYMEIVGVGQLVAPGSRNTKIQTLQITFKSLDGKRIIGYFEPMKSRDTTIGIGRDKIKISRLPGKIVLDQQEAGVQINIRPIRTMLSFTVHMPTSVLLQSHGLLASGCPPRQRLA